MPVKGFTTESKREQRERVYSGVKVNKKKINNY